MAPKAEQKIYVGIGLDFETGGLDCRECACTQIALQAVRLDTWQTIDSYQAYISPYCRRDTGIPRKKVLRTRHGTGAGGTDTDEIRAECDWGKLRADFGRAFGTKEKQVKGRKKRPRELAAETVDMTLPVNRKPLGARHPLPKLMEDVEDFFISMGWQISSGPEIEAEWYNFDSLNFGPDHPARQMQDTFYVKGNQAKDAAGFVGSNMVVRTQTSSDQSVPS